MSSITSSSGSAEWKIDDLLKYVKQEVESREVYNLLSNNSTDKRKYSVPHSNNFTASALFTDARKILIQWYAYIAEKITRLLNVMLLLI